MIAKRIRLIYGIVLSVVLIAAGICLIGACLEVYRSGGEQIYTAEKIASAFARISVPVYVALALVIGGFILHMVLPPEKEKRRAEKNYALMLRKLHEKNDLSACGDQKLAAAVQRQTRLRRLHSRISLVVLDVCAIVFLSYALNADHFHSSEITESMVRAMYVMLPCLLIPFGYAVFTAYFCKSSVKKELELMKLVAAPKKPEPVPVRDHTRALNILRVSLLVAAVCLIVVGFLGDGWKDVLTKAVNICRECVGLG